MAKKIAFLFLFFWSIALNAQAVENKYFSLPLPSGWEQEPVKDNMDTAGAPLIFVNRSRDCVVGISIAENAESAREAADKAQADMPGRNLECGPMAENGGIYSFSVKSGKANGNFYYASNGKELCVVTIWGSPDMAKSLFAALKPADPALFPKF